MLPKKYRPLALLLGAALTTFAAGCETLGSNSDQPAEANDKVASYAGSGPSTPCIRPAPKAEPVDDSQLPKELNKVTMPPYVVEPPDILLITANRLVPLPPYRVEPLDVVYLFAPNAAEKFPINGLFPVEPDGTIDLGPNYGGGIRVADLTIPELQTVISTRLKNFLKDSTVNASIAQSRGLQTIRGEHLVRPDGTVSLGLYGSVYVTGMTLGQAKLAIEQHLGKYLQKPEVSVDVHAYNSKFYYVITDFAGSGEQVTRLPSTGNETVLDAISLVGGLSAVSTKRIWVARPAPSCTGDQILPVDWKGITRRGNTRTNFQILPGDRVFIMGNPLTKIDTTLARISAPMERVFNTSLLGYTTVKTLGGSTNVLGGGTTVNVAGTGATTTK